MRSETTMMATQYRLLEWASQIKDCQARPTDMSVAEWCSINGLTKANYYYRLRRVRAACLDSLSEEMYAQQVVPVEPNILLKDKENSPIPNQGVKFRSM